VKSPCFVGKRMGLRNERPASHGRAIGYEVGDGDQLEAVALFELQESVQPHHPTILVDDLAKNADGLEAGHHAQVDRSLGVARPAQDTALFRPERDRWPGRAKSSPIASSSQKTSTVLERSKAETPVVVPRMGVDGLSHRRACLDVFSLVIIGTRSSCRRSSVVGIHGTPRPWVIMKFIASGVHFSPAMMRSPSFSRSGSSTTMIHLAGSQLFDRLGDAREVHLSSFYAFPGA